MGNARVGIVVDSAANLPEHIIQRHDIAVVPMILKFGESISLDGIDLNPTAFYEALVAQNVPVSTSAPSIGDFRTRFEDALARFESVVCVTVASFVSATHDAAVAAARDLAPDRITVIDSKSASLGEGFAALEAARLADEGADLAAVAARATEIAGRASFVATINTFEFLKRSGRVNALMAYAATALNIKPVFGFRGGKVEQLGRPRTRARAIDRIVSEAREASSAGPLRLGVAHAACPEDAAALVATLTAEIPHEGEILLTEFTPLMGAHTGPGLLGIAYWV